MKIVSSTILIPFALLGGCTSLGLPASMGETSSSYGYVPLDPLPIDEADNSDSCKLLARSGTRAGDTTAKPAASKRTALKKPAGEQGSVVEKGNNRPDYLPKLPDQTIRFAVASFDASGSLTFGPSKLTTKGNQYRAVLDYIQADAVPVEFYIRKLVAHIGKDGRPDQKAIAVPLDMVVFRDFKIVGYDVKESRAQQLSRQLALSGKTLDSNADTRNEIAAFDKAQQEDGYSVVTFPIYVGVGLRLSADVLALEGGVTLAGLGAIGADAEAKKISGTLTVQALGVSGKAIATALPLPSKLDQTTIENAILAVGNMRATLYASSVGADGVWIKPRVVGLYSPIGSNPTLINAVYSELSRTRPRWYVPCQLDQLRTDTGAE